MDSNFTLNNDCLRQQIYFQANAFRAIAIFLVNIPLCVMTLLGNAAILITVFKTPSLHRPAHILMAGLALSDCDFGFILQPLLLSIVLSAGYNYDLPLATFRLLCSSFDCSAIVYCGVSLGTSTAIALDRLLALRLHLRYAAIVTKFRVIVVFSMYLVVSGIFDTNVFLASENLWQSSGHKNLCSNSCKLRPLFQYPPRRATSSDSNSVSTPRATGQHFQPNTTEEFSFKHFSCVYFPSRL